jgi:diguanylate cyclase (GGDEF)-like protein/PAS domain S-box-containing protein
MIDMENQQTEFETKNGLAQKIKFWTEGWGGKVVVFGILVTLFHQLYLYYHWGGDQYVNAVNDSISIIIYFCAFLLVFRTARHPSLEVRTKKAWGFFAVAYFSYTFASGLWGYFEVITETQPFPSWADPFYLAFYPLMFVGLLLAAPRFRTHEERVKLALDAGIVTLGSGMLLWYFLLQPLAQSSTGDSLMTALSLAYPVCDLVLVFGISVGLFRGSAGEIQWGMNLLLAGIVLTFVADVVFGYQNLNGTYVGGTASDSLYTISSLLAVLAAHYQFVESSGKTEEAVETQKVQKSLHWLPYSAIAAGYLLLLTFAAENLDQILNQLVIISGVLIALVVLRQLIFVRENIHGKAALQELQERFQGIYNSSKDAIGFSSFDGSLIDVNDSFAAMLGYTKEELLAGKTYRELTPPEYHNLNNDSIKRSIELDQPCEYEKEYLRKDGTRVPVAVTSYPVKGNDGKPMGLAAIIRDITERRRNEEQLMHNALHDALTNLPNRTLFLEHLRAAINRNARSFGANFAVLFLDFDRFKIINDSLGHLEGDKLLILIAARLRSSLRSGDIVARLGGDEFTILLDAFEDPDDVLRIVERIENSLKEPFNLTEREIFISASIGVAVSNAGYTKPDEMLRDADTAMYYAKAAGKARHQFFTREMYELASKRLRLENEMRPALERGEFCLYYQPIIELESHRIKGFEALVRWEHPVRGLISPNDFIPVAEETGFIVALGEWVLRESCRQLREWQTQTEANSDWTISVNLSCKQFLQIDLAETVAAILSETRLSPKHLHLEVTESNVMEDNKAAIEIMTRLQTLGVKISIDDFGTGYSSLSHLHHLPIDYLKIDRSFISEMLEHHKNAEIVRTILMLAEGLGIEVIAEGIETEAQFEQLVNLNCKHGQGYLFSAPLEARKMQKWFANGGFPETRKAGDKPLKPLMLQPLTVNRLDLKAN